MILHGYFRSSAAYRCRIAFNLKGIDPEQRHWHLRKAGGEQKSGAYRSINPQALVPSLDIGDGAILTQSLAIIEWLDETHREPPLLPDDPVGRAKVRAFAQAIACDIHPLQNLRVLEVLRRECGQDQAGVEAWCRRWISDGLAACEVLAQRDGGTFCIGDRLTVADICLIPQLFSADRFHVDLSAMPTLRAIRDVCEALPAFSRAHPSKQPDAEN